MGGCNLIGHHSIRELSCMDKAHLRSFFQCVAIDIKTYGYLKLQCIQASIFATMSPKVSLAVNVSAFICSSALIGIAVAAIYLASDAHESFTRKFNPSSYGWMPARWYNDGVGFSVLIGYNQSSVIKTYAAAAMSIVVGVTGIFAFGLSFKVRAHLGIRLDYVPADIF